MGLSQSSKPGNLRNQILAEINLVIIRENEVALEASTHPPTHKLNKIVRDTPKLGICCAKSSERVCPNMRRVQIWEVSVYIGLQGRQQSVVFHGSTRGFTGFVQLLKERQALLLTKLGRGRVQGESHQTAA